MSSPSFEPSCPAGGSWYACGNGASFTGCCASDPCNDVGCPAGNLYPASFDASSYGTFPDQECSAGSWYTCTATSPPFLGCCKSNPCAWTTGCPSSDLAAGYLSANPTIANQYDPVPPLAVNAMSSMTVQSSAAATAANPSARISQTAGSTPNSTAVAHSSSNVGAIAGGAAGGAVALIVLGLLVWFLMRRRSRSKVTAPAASHVAYEDSPVPQTSQTLGHEKSYYAVPTTYDSDFKSPHELDSMQGGLSSPIPPSYRSGPSSPSVYHSSYVTPQQTAQAWPGAQMSPAESGTRTMSPALRAGQHQSQELFLEHNHSGWRPGLSELDSGTPGASEMGHER